VDLRHDRGDAAHLHHRETPEAKREGQQRAQARLQTASTQRLDARRLAEAVIEGGQAEDDDRTGHERVS
jgi:hypothetical protein